MRFTNSLKLSYLFLAIMLSICIAGCGNAKNASVQPGDSSITSGLDHKDSALQDTGQKGTLTKETLTPAPTMITTPQPDEKLNNTPDPQTAAPDQGTNTTTVASADAEKIISNLANDVMVTIKSNDMKKLAVFVHPDKGVRFSAYSNVHPETDIVFHSAQLKQISGDTKNYNWGDADGSGEPINLSFAAYYKKYIYDHDFVNAKQKSYNKILGKGNLINNIMEIYPNSIVAEFYFPGFDKTFEGHDWVSLRLVFEEKAGTWYLVGIVHDQWTL